MKLKITPHPLAGRVQAVASKSDVHRAMICAALADRETVLTAGAANRDIEATAECLRALGARLDSPDGRHWRIAPVRCPAEEGTIDCGESGSTLRFLLPLIPALGLRRTVTGSGRLPQRPLSPLRELLEEHGALIEGKALPLELSGGLAPGRYSLPGNVSSQYVTGLLFALPLLPGESEIVLTTPLESAGYVEMTLRTLRRFGIRISPAENGWRIPGGQRYRSPGELSCEGDWSNAAFYLAAGALRPDGGPVTVGGLDPASPQGDRAIVGLLRRFGAAVEETAGGSVSVAPRPLRGIDIDAAAIPDLVPILAVCGCAAEGETRIFNAARLRLKESDRLQTVSAAIRALGGDADELPDGLVIRGRALSGWEVDCANDHRIVMSMAMAAMLCGGPVVLDGAEACRKSYPGFFDDYQSLGGIADVL